MDFDLIDAVLTARRQLDLVAVGILHRKRHRRARIGNRKLSVAARDAGRDRIADVIYLEHRSQQSETILAHAAADRQHLLVGQPDLLGVKCAHLVQPVGENSHVDESLCQFHFDLPQMRRALICGTILAYRAISIQSRMGVRCARLRWGRHNKAVASRRLLTIVKYMPTTNQSWDPDAYARNARFVSDLGAPVVELLAPRAGERILDLGCGDGALTKKLVELGCDVVGVDASAPQVEAACRLGLDARVADGERLAFDAEFDAVFSNAAIHWMKAAPDEVI